ncbi:MAG: hypothetical protein UHS41_04450 [Lachnospiraceae bacterium]|nr:hypothetical protein [Lachnospiraceae bacterium]
MEKVVRFDSEITGTEAIGRIIDIENSEKAKASAGYEYWAKLYNLQEQSKTLNYLTENGLLNSEKLDQDQEKLTGLYQQCRTDMKETETELKSVNRQLRLLGQYYKLKQKQYEDYKVLRVQWVELNKLAKNRDSMLGQDKQTELGNKKPII